MPDRIVPEGAPLKTWYRTHDWQYTIVPVRVVRETAKMLVLAARKRWDGTGPLIEQPKFNSGIYFRTYAEARAALVERAMQSIASYELALAEARRDLDTANALPMKAPNHE
jgi:hypothetical protein